MIRPARPEDAGQVGAISGLDDTPPPVTMRGSHAVRHLLGPRPRSLLRAAEAEGVAAGFVTASPAHDSAHDADCFIDVDLHVRPDFRRRGVGRAVMAAIAGEGRRRGAACLCWGVDDGDAEATAFYISLGAAVEHHVPGRIPAGAAHDTLAAEAEP